MEKNYRRYYSQGETASAFFLILDQSYFIDSSRMQTFGLAFNSSAMALFEPPIRDMTNANPLLTRDALESTVFVHEFGHLLGLVNMGLPMVQDHLDKDHGSRGHCRNPRCLMYYAVNTALSYSIEGGRSYKVPPLDQDCLSDLRNSGGN